MGRISCSLVMCVPLVLNFLLFNSFAWASNHGVGDTLDNNLVASVQPLGSYSDVDAFLRGCMQNYGSKAVRRVKDQWAQTGVCLERIFFTDHIAKQSDGLLIRIPSDNRTTTSMNDAPITSLCNNHIPDIEQCIQSFIVALKGCTAVQGDHDLQSLGYALSGALNYACQHEGDRIVRFVAGGGTECLKEPHDADILDCFPLRHSFLTRLQGNDSIFQKENCRIHQESNECIVRVFEQCTNPSSNVKDIIRGLLNTIMSETKCGSYIHTVNESGPSASYNNSFAVLLLCILVCIIHKRLLELPTRCDSSWSFFSHRAMTISPSSTAITVQKSNLYTSFFTCGTTSSAFQISPALAC